MSGGYTYSYIPY
ncbi:hypothetical protein VTL71DRAFT_4594 [Oculimacula yallundae]|uniref:Uncharacterized protein n=1 Tax=Oculimacula yallundae TaxID=86028 RepID=A0ABR4C2G5_9HELO